MATRQHRAADTSHQSTLEYRKKPCGTEINRFWGDEGQPLTADPWLNGFNVLS